jgi:hypothetical protein
MARKITTEQIELNTHLDEIAERGMEQTKKWVSLWQQNLRYFFSSQLEGYRNREAWEWVVLNYIWPSAMQEIAKLTKNEPKIITRPWEAGDTEASEVWQSHLQWQWKDKPDPDHGMRFFQMCSLHDKKLFGISITKVFWEDMCYWEDSQKTWMGDVKIVLWHPAHFWADDDENILNGNCGTDRWVPLDWAQKRWPEFAKELEDEATENMDAVGGTASDTIRGQRGLTGGVGGVDKGIEKVRPTPLLDIITESDQMTGSAGSVRKQKVVRVQEFYLKDYETEKKTQETDISSEALLSTGQIYQDTQGSFLDTVSNSPITPENWPKETTRQWDEPKYPYGRYIIRVGTLILNPRYEQQRYPHRRWPFIVSPHYLIPHMWRGVDGVQMYRSVQDMINVSASHLFNNMKMFGDSQIWAEEDTLIPAKEGKKWRILGGAGAINIFRKGSLSRGKVQRMPPDPASQSAGMLYQLFTSEYKNIQGLQSIAKGEKMPGKITATEAQYLAMSSVDRIAFQAAIEDMWVRSVASAIAEVCQYYYDAQRFMRIVGEDQTQGVVQITQKLKDVKYDVDIIPGMTLPFDEEKRIEKYLTAYKLLSEPVANPMLPDVLRILDIHNWKKILSQHEVYQQYLQFVQLYQSVVEGKIAPDIAVEMLTRKAMELYQQNGMQQGVQATQDREAAMKTQQMEGKKQPAGSAK